MAVNAWGITLADIAVGDKVRAAPPTNSRYQREVSGTVVAVGIARVKTAARPYWGRFGYGSASWQYDESKPGNWVLIEQPASTTTEPIIEAVNISRIRKVGEEAIAAEDAVRDAQRALADEEKRRTAAERIAAKAVGAEERLREVFGANVYVSYGGKVEVPVTALIEALGATGVEELAKLADDYAAAVEAELAS